MCCPGFMLGSDPSVAAGEGEETSIATPTKAVWISAIAAVSSLEEEKNASTMAGVSTFESGPISRIEAPSSRTLATKMSSQAANSRASGAAW